jgi:four helix bundle protein
MTDDGRPETGDRPNVTDDGRLDTEDRSARHSEPVTRPQLQKPVSSLPSPVPSYKFQGLQVYQLALQYLDSIYTLAHNLPYTEKFNLRSQLERAATSVVLNIAEGSTGQSDPEQSRFTSMALRSYLETVACLDIAERRGYLASSELKPIRASGHQLFVKLWALRKALSRPSSVSSPRSS